MVNQKYECKSIAKKLANDKYYAKNKEKWKENYCKNARTYYADNKEKIIAQKLRAYEYKKAIKQLNACLLGDCLSLGE